MDFGLSIVGIGSVVLVFGAISLGNVFFALGRLSGIREAMNQIASGVSAHYEHEGGPIPKRVQMCIARMKAQVAKAQRTREKCDAFNAHLWNFGYEMGTAAWQDGFDVGCESILPQDGRIRVDLSLKELMNIRGLAHFGFTNMMWNKNGLSTFKYEKDAEEAALAIERLEFSIPTEQRDQDDPYALSFDRQTMIWDRWPSEKRQS